MKKVAIALFSLGSLMSLSITNASALPLEGVSLNAEETVMTERLQALYPKNKIRWVRQTPVANLWEVTMGTNIAYVAADLERLKKTDVATLDKTEHLRYWLFGASIFDMKDGVDLTANARSLAQRIDVTELPLKQAITRRHGNGSRVLYVFTDPDCPHCRRLEMSLENVPDLTIHTFLTPITALHPKAREVSAGIWCAGNRAKALLDYMTGNGLAPATAACETPLLENEKLMERLSIKGTPTIFFETGDRHTGAMTTDALIKELARIEQMKKNR